LTEEDWHKKSARERGAAAVVNGLLNAAIIPPFGYGGSIRDLVDKQHLADDEVLFAKSSLTPNLYHNSTDCESPFPSQPRYILSNHGECIVKLLDTRPAL
jgi:hypothetical protein